MKINEKIKNELFRIEREKGVRILYACESGSRAWGFASQDSDYDVRFIYVHNMDWYLSIHEGRDVIESMLDERNLDLSGWDLKKTLRLFLKSNPPLLEWLQSPIVYVEDREFVNRFRALLPDFYSPRRSMYHYLHMAKGNYEKYLQKREVSLKKYLYVLRPLLACQWIEQSFGPVPVEFEVLVDSLIEDRNLKNLIYGLLTVKRDGGEKSKIPRIDSFHQFIDLELGRLLAQNWNLDDPYHATEQLNQLFRSTVNVEHHGIALNELTS